MATTHGTFREWHPEDGWGVLNSPDTPGGCWVHYSAVDPASLDALDHSDQGVPTSFDFEQADQDGFAFRATAVPAGAEVTPEPSAPSSAYSSELVIDLDDDGPAPTR